MGGRGWAASHSLLCGPGGSWNTLASDVFDCCYLTGKLSRGGAYTFRTACVSKAGMGPYSSPSEQVLLGGPSRLGEPLGRPLWECARHCSRSPTDLGWFILPTKPLTHIGLRHEKAECWGFTEGLPVGLGKGDGRRGWGRWQCRVARPQSWGDGYAGLSSS